MKKKELVEWIFVSTSFIFEILITVANYESLNETFVVADVVIIVVQKLKIENVIEICL